jgi:hypothetical protein
MSDDDDAADEISGWNREDATDLQRPKNAASYALQIASRDWTVKTMVEQIKEGNIDLDPVFQRRNAWKDTRRSRLIESFVLNFPVPQIVLAENPREKKKFIVIDGKQRLLTIASTYLPTYREYWDAQKLTGLNIMTKLNDVELDQFLSSPEFSDNKRQLDNADIRTTVISGFSDENVLYDIFYRINTGSVPLSSQELRQVLNRGEFAKYLMTLTSTDNALWPVLGIDRPDPRLRDVELLLRLVAWKTNASAYQGNMKPFLDDTMSALNASWDSKKTAITKLGAQIMEAVQAVTKIFGEYAGRKFNGAKYERALNRAIFEVQTYYLTTPAARAAFIKSKKAVVTAFQTLSDDPGFRASVEATTKSIENYKVRFDKYRLRMGKVVGLSLEPLPLHK